MNQTSNAPNVQAIGYIRLYARRQPFGQAENCVPEDCESFARMLTKM